MESTEDIHWGVHVRENEDAAHFVIDPKSVAQTESVFFAFLSNVDMLVDAISHLMNTRTEIEIRRFRNK